MKGIVTFTLGALAGAAAAALLTPVSGEELRERIKENLRRRGIIAADEVDALVDVISAEIEKSQEDTTAPKHHKRRH